MGSKLDLAVRQARLLAEAAFVPLADAFDSTGLAAKPKRRAGRGLPFGFDELAPEPTAGEPQEDSDSEIPNAESSVLPETVASEEPAPAPTPAPAAEAPPTPDVAAETVPAEAAADAAPAEAKPPRRGRKKADPKPPETA